MCRLGNVKCDIYVKVLIGSETYQTTTAADNNYPSFYETFETGKVRRSDSITLQIWDNDYGVNDDDLLFQQTLTVSKLLQDDVIAVVGEKTIYKIFYCANWYDNNDDINVQNCPQSK